MPRTPTDAKTPDADSPAAVAMAEVQRLTDQVAQLQADAEARDAADAHTTYAHPAQGSGHLDERLARVAAAMARIPKRGRNTQQNYDFVAHPDVVDAVRPALAAEGVRFKAELVSMRIDEQQNANGATRTTSGGAVFSFWTCTVDFTFSCWVGGHALVDDGPRSVREEDTTRWVGYAEDFGDKGGSKAMTAALKTYLIATFLLSAGDDPDDQTRAADGGQRSSSSSRQDDTEVRVARRAALDWNEKLPTGVLGKIARKVAGEGRVMQIDNVQHLALIAKAAERYALTEPGTPEREAANDWVEGRAPAPDPQAAAEAPDAAVVAPGEGPDVPPTASADADAAAGPTDLPYEPATPVAPWGIPVESYDPPLTDDEARQHALGLNPRPPVDDDDTPF